MHANLHLNTLVGNVLNGLVLNLSMMQRKGKCK